MDSVNKTLYIPLYGKAFVSAKGLFLKDEKAEEIWSKAGFRLTGKAKSKWLAYYMGIRSAVFDGWVKEKAADDAVVLHLGCGLDSRVLRTMCKNRMWYDVDFPEVIAERRKYFTETDHYKMLSGDVRENAWLSSIPETRRAVVVLEGVSMYLSPKELQDLFDRLCARFDRLDVLMDCYSSLAAKLSAYRNPINTVGVTKVYGLDRPKSLQNKALCFVKELNITPQRFINELHGAERAIFEKLYAGGFSKKLYRLYEYRKGAPID